MHGRVPQGPLVHFLSGRHAIEEHNVIWRLDLLPPHARTRQRQMKGALQPDRRQRRWASRAEAGNLLRCDRSGLSARPAACSGGIPTGAWSRAVGATGTRTGVSTPTLAVTGCKPPARLPPTGSGHNLRRSDARPSLRPPPSTSSSPVPATPTSRPGTSATTYARSPHQAPRGGRGAGRCRAARRPGWPSPQRLERVPRMWAARLRHDTGRGNGSRSARG